MQTVDDILQCLKESAHAHRLKLGVAHFVNTGSSAVMQRRYEIAELRAILKNSPADRDQALLESDEPRRYIISYAAQKLFSYGAILVEVLGRSCMVGLQGSICQRCPIGVLGMICLLGPVGRQRAFNLAL